jgi:DNA-binding NarL/FixJ family response regulator
VTAARIRVAIVDDHPALRDGTALLLEQQGDIDVVGRVDSLSTARELMEGEDPPDVVILDIRLAEERGLDLLVGPRLPGRRPAIVIWTGFDLPQYAAFAFQAGAAGFVVKNAPLGELVTAIRTAAAGGLYYTRSAEVGTALSPREREIVVHLVAGQSNDQISALLGISTRTVEMHLTHLYQRFSIGSRTELAARVLQEAWLDLPPERTIPVKRPGG